MEYGWLTLLPPLIAIVCALVTRQVILSLFLGIWIGWTVLAGWNPLSGMGDALQSLIDVFADGYNTKVILFSALVGSLITLAQRSGGVAGFVEWMRSLNIGGTHRSAGLVAFFTGVSVFVESSVTCLVVGAVARPLSDKVKMAREKLAYICDSTSAPICILIPLNAWGAYIMGLLIQEDVENPLGLMLKSIPLNFYALIALGVTFGVVVTNFNFGPMKKAEKRASEEGKLLADGAIPMMSTEITALEPKPGVAGNKWNMLVPILTMIAMMPAGLYITGRAAILGADENASIDFFSIMGEGSGSTAVYWSVLAAIAVAAIMYLAQRIMTLHEIFEMILKGAGGLMPMAIIMMLAFALGATCKELGTGPYVAEFGRQFLKGAFVPAVLFLLACIIAFSTGTSWGTFAIMIPIGVPLAEGTGAGLAVAVAAILGGGVFGDHCSPISDTSVVSSMATACDHVDHVKTQLPYAAACAAGAFVLYLIAGALFTG